MKKFSKILTLVLALVIIVTAFTVVALADNEVEPKRYSLNAGYDYTFESGTVGGITGFNWGSKQAKDDFVQIREAYDGGNKYLWLSGNAYNENASVYTYGSSKNEDREKYGIGKTPIMSLDFDVMTLNGSWGAGSNNGNSAGFYLRPYYWTGSSWTNPTETLNKIAYKDMGLSTQAYLWQHITLVTEYYTVYDAETDTTTHKIGIRTFVNGVETSAKGTFDISAKYSSLTEEQIKTFFIPEVYFTGARYYTGTSEHTPYGEEIAVDNLQYAFYEAGYDVSAIPTLVYNDSWEAPFGQLIATVTVEDKISYFDDINKAAEFAKANNAVVSLAQNVAAAFNLDSELTLDANIYDENGNSTGTYTFAYPVTTLGYYLEETEAGSGIYEAKKGDFLVTKNGLSSAYPESQFDSKFKAITAGSTLNLLTDIETSSTFSLGSNFNNVTLDLNGYNLISIAYTGNEYQAVKNEETGEFTYPTDNPTEVTATAGTFFTYNSANVNFTVTSSRPGSSIARYLATAETWKYDGEVVKRVISKTVGASFAEMTKENITLNVRNVSVYTTRLVNQGSGSPDNQQVYINNSNIYMTTTGCYMIYSYHKKNFTLEVNNSLIYFPSGGHGYLFRWVNATTSGTTKVRFTNSDMIMNTASYGLTTTVASGVNHDALYDNCRTYNFSTVSIPGSNGTLGYYSTEKSNESSVPKAAEGYTQVDVNISVPYTVPKAMTAKATEGLVESATIPTATTSFSLKFNKLDTKPIDINLVGADGEIMETTQLRPGVDRIDDALPTIKILLEDNPYLNAVYQWADKNGNAIPAGVLGLTAKGVAWPAGVTDAETGETTYSYTFYAKESIDGVTKYVGGIKDVSFNIGFLSGFRYILYLPVNDRLTEIAVDGYVQAPNTVLINGRGYYAFSSLIGAAAAAENSVISASFKVDGVDYNQSWNVSAATYVNIFTATYPNASSAEKTAVGAMLKLIKESALVKDSTANVTALDEAIASLGLELTYGDYTEGDIIAALADLDGAVTGVQYVIYNGVAAYRFTLAAEDTEVSFSVNGKNVDFTREGNVVTLDAQRVYDIIADITITSGEKSTVFNMVDYLTYFNADASANIAKALYEFGVAADAYKAAILANN